MQTTREELQVLADDIASFCSDVRIKEDENGPLLLAYGLKDNHSLEFRKVGDNYVVELWHGKTAEEEVVVGEVSFPTILNAKRKAEEWLLKDAI